MPTNHKIGPQKLAMTTACLERKMLSPFEIGRIQQKSMRIYIGL